MAASSTAFSYRVTPVNCFLSAREEVDELVFAFRWALVSGWVKFFNWEFPLEVKADCAIKLQLETCLGQGYKCDVRTSEGGRVAVATIAKGGDHDLVATLQAARLSLHHPLHQPPRLLENLAAFKVLPKMGGDFCRFDNFFRLLKTWESPWRAQLKMA